MSVLSSLVSMATFDVAGTCHVVQHVSEPASGATRSIL